MSTDAPAPPDLPANATAAAPAPVGAPGVAPYSPAPPAPPAAAPQPSRNFRVASIALTAIGIVAVCFAVFALFATAAMQQRDQQRLRSDLETRLVIDRASADTGAEAEGGVVAEEAFGGGEEDPEAAGAAGQPTADDGPPGPGDALALLRIPSIGVDQVVVVGTGTEQLRSGPGHLRGTSKPGERGNVVIAGKRSTYGAPFADLDALREDSVIELGTAAGTYRYRVQSVEVVEPGEADVVGPATENRLTLFTSHPEYRAGERLVVVAEFDGDTPGPPLVRVPAGFEPTEVELGLGRDGNAWPSVGLFTVLIMLAVAGLVWARRQWTTWAVYAVGAPVLLALSVLLFENVLRLFPSTL